MSPRGRLRKHFSEFRRRKRVLKFRIRLIQGNRLATECPPERFYEEVRIISISSIINYDFYI
jgi:hypothetical protein